VSLVATAAGAARAGGGGGRPSERVLSVLAIVLTFASGGVDVIIFARLGNVFASVMTGNIVVFGLSLARGSLSLGLHTGAAVCGYVVGVAAGTRFGSRRAREDGSAAGSGWPPRAASLLVAELVLVAGFVVGWEVTGFHPAGAAQIVMLVVAACAMGLQSASVVRMDLGSVSTTYLTGTLTSLVSSLVQRDGASRDAGLRRPGVLFGLLAGATLAGLLVAYADAIAPFPPLLAVAAAAGLASGRLRPGVQDTGVQDNRAPSDRAGGAHQVTHEYLRD
jgi:uncharacterized membrane protein YoaK (UPF0700 family)